MWTPFADVASSACLGAISLHRHRQRVTLDSQIGSTPVRAASSLFSHTLWSQTSPSTRFRARTSEWQRGAVPEGVRKFLRADVGIQRGTADHVRHWARSARGNPLPQPLLVLNATLLFKARTAIRSQRPTDTRPRHRLPALRVRARALLLGDHRDGAPPHAGGLPRAHVGLDAADHPRHALRRQVANRPSGEPRSMWNTRSMISSRRCAPLTWSSSSSEVATPSRTPRSSICPICRRRCRARSTAIYVTNTAVLSRHLRARRLFGELSSSRCSSLRSPGSSSAKVGACSASSARVASRGAALRLRRVWRRRSMFEAARSEASRLFAAPWHLFPSRNWAAEAEMRIIDAAVRDAARGRPPRRGQPRCTGGKNNEHVAGRLRAVLLHERAVAPPIERRVARRTPKGRGRCRGKPLAAPPKEKPAQPDEIRKRLAATQIGCRGGAARGSAR